MLSDESRMRILPVTQTLIWHARLLKISVQPLVMPLSTVLTMAKYRL